MSAAENRKTPIPLLVMMMMIALITFKSSLVPLLEGLWSSNSWEFEVSGFRRNNSVASSGVKGWQLIRSCAEMIFCLATSLAALISPFPVPQYPRYLHASSRFIAWRVSPLIVNSVAGSCSLRFLSLSITTKYVFFTLICIPHRAVNSWTTFSSFCMPLRVAGNPWVCQPQQQDGKTRKSFTTFVYNRKRCLLLHALFMHGMAS